MQTLLKKIFPLDEMGVDLASEETEEFFLANCFRYDSVLKFRLSLESLLLVWLEKGLRGSDITLSISPAFRKYTVTLCCRGERCDPFAADDDTQEDAAFFNKLSKLSGSLFYSYSDGVNAVTAELPKPGWGPAVKNPASVVLAVGIGLACNIWIPDPLYLKEAYIAPIYGKMTALALTAAAPVLFLSMTSAFINVSSAMNLHAAGKKLFSSMILMNAVILALFLMISFLIFPYGETACAVAPFTEFLLSFMPANVLAPFEQCSAVQLSLLAAALAFVLLSNREAARGLISGTETAGDTACSAAVSFSSFSYLFIFFGMLNATLAHGDILFLKIILVTAIVSGFGVLLTALVHCVWLAAAEPRLLGHFMKAAVPAVIETLRTGSPGETMRRQESALKELGTEARFTAFSVQLTAVIYRPAALAVIYVTLVLLAFFFGVPLTFFVSLGFIATSAVLAFASPELCGVGAVVMIAACANAGMPAEAAFTAASVGIALQSAAAAANVFGAMALTLAADCRRKEGAA